MVRPNEARPLFRVLAGVFGTLFLTGFVFALYLILTEPPDSMLQQFAVTTGALAVIFLFVAFAGYMPKWLVRILSGGKPTGYEDMK